jgi:circadian clock protein KaiB
MRLYIAGMTPNSMQAIINLRQIFQANLPDRYELDIIDLVQNPGMAADQHIVATPTLVKFFPLPMHRFVGNMSNKTMILLGLNIQPIKSRAT